MRFLNFRRFVTSLRNGSGFGGRHLVEVVRRFGRGPSSVAEQHQAGSRQARFENTPEGKMILDLSSINTGPVLRHPQ